MNRLNSRLFNISEGSSLIAINTTKVNQNTFRLMHVAIAVVKLVFRAVAMDHAISFVAIATAAAIPTVIRRPGNGN